MSNAKTTAPQQETLTADDQPAGWAADSRGKGRADVSVPGRMHVVGAAIIEPAEATRIGKERRVLAAQRSESMSHPLLWELPGGKIEIGETPEEALAREIREELSIDIEVGKWLGSCERELAEPGGGRRLLLEVFLCRQLSGEIQLVEHRTWRWVGASQLSTLAWSPADQPLLAKLRRYLKSER